ncbi:chromatin-binding exonuclease XRN1 PWA37_000354 [Arxiozyma heterogenica]|uniref:chromatin-binding exonuclease XRN1 n=1 Tax=Arxiozyma heterogenica TaxID=278026 RepID=UPI002F108594
MGIPKFFRYISERWPMISQLIEGSPIPEFDNLYLDMNSILHTCTHGDDIDLVTSSRLSEEEIFARIFTYIDHLFLTIKPKKVFYMAIDGVAPRAKMNQQRARRFRSAMDAEKALAKSETPINKGDIFDSNAITPGTEFMAKLTKNLKYFINNKVSHDSNWSGIKIILSGHEVPGEGEHKIMNFIRNIKSSNVEDSSNIRHCIYGLDADLIMLGLSTHAPHFALLREEVVFGKQRSSQYKTLEQQNFYLLHLSLLREYMELEFREIADILPFQYDFERILDDFILIMFVIGNDFLPNLPDLHLNKGAFPVILQTFKEALLHLDGYINEHGKINLKRLNIWLKYLSQFELMNFEKDDIDIDWFNQQLENISLEGERKRAKHGQKLLIRQQKKLVGFVKPWITKLTTEIDPKTVDDSDPKLCLLLPKDTDDKDGGYNIKNNLPFVKKLTHDLGLFIIHSKSKDTYTLKFDVDGVNPHETVEERHERIAQIRKTIKNYQSSLVVEDEEELEKEKNIYDSRFEDWKLNYYKDKFHFKDKESIINVAKNYVEGLQWVLYYYYRGCPAWGWYYHYHYAPRISDLALGLDQTIQFDLGSPFKPFEQLMSVLPERSKNLIPTALRPLMYDSKSPILDFYPDAVELDMNGKTADWEAVVLLPFVDENRLRDAMKPYMDKLTLEEKQRNELGTDLQFIFNPQVDTVYKTPLKGVFTDIEHNHCVEKPFHLEKLDPDQIKYGLLPNDKMGVNILAGFPTLQTIPFTASLQYNETLVFQQPSRQQSMVLEIEDIYDENNLTLDELAKRYIGKIVYTKWPYLRESKLISIFDENSVFEGKHTVDNQGKKHFKVIHRSADIHEQKEFKQLNGSMMKNYKKQMAVLLKNIRAFVKVVPVTGLIRNSEGAYIKTYAKTSEVYPLQLMVESISNVDERYIEKPPVPIEQEFPLNSRVIFLGDYAYGSETTINGYSSTRRLKITVNKKSRGSEPTIGKEMVARDASLIHYFPSFVIAKELNLNRLFLARITSKFLIADNEGKQVNVGIPVKFEAKHQKVLGYARKNQKGWEYSNLTVNLLKEYSTRFPHFFYNLSKIPTSDIPMLQDLLPNLSSSDSTKELNEIKNWLKYVTELFVTVSFESDSLSKGSIRSVEDYIIAHSFKLEQCESKNLAKVPREAILDPRESISLLRTQRFNLGDRVMYIQDSGKVPLYSKGTVVGYTTLGLNVSVQVLFDHEIVAGNTFGGRLRTKRGLGLDSSFLLNLTDRQLVYHSKASMENKTRTKGLPNESNNAVNEKRLRQKKERKARQEADKIRKEVGHNLLSLIQKNQDTKAGLKEKEVEQPDDIVEKEVQSAENEQDSSKPLESLLNRNDEAKKEAKLPESLPPNKAVATSVFNAVLNQIESTDDQSNHPPTESNNYQPTPYHTLDPASLPYHMPPVVNSMYVMGNNAQPIIGTIPPTHPHPHGHAYPYSTGPSLPNSHPYPNDMPPSGQHLRGPVQYPPMVPPGFVPHQGILSGNAPAHAKVNQELPVDKKGTKKLQHISKNAKGKNSTSKKKIEASTNQSNEKKMSEKVEKDNKKESIKKEEE